MVQGSGTTVGSIVTRVMVRACSLAWTAAVRACVICATAAARRWRDGDDA